MLSEQRTLFEAAFDAQATVLANSVGSASVADEVSLHLERSSARSVDLPLDSG